MTLATTYPWKAPDSITKTTEAPILSSPASRAIRPASFSSASRMRSPFICVRSFTARTGLKSTSMRVRSVSVLVLRSNSWWCPTTARHSRNDRCDSNVYGTSDRPKKGYATRLPPSYTGHAGTTTVPMKPPDREARRVAAGAESPRDTPPLTPRAPHGYRRAPPICPAPPSQGCWGLPMPGAVSTPRPAGQTCERSRSGPVGRDAERQTRVAYEVAEF